VQYAVVTLADGVTSMKAGTARSSDATKMKMKMPNKCRATYLLIHTDVAEAAKARLPITASIYYYYYYYTRLTACFPGQQG